MFWCLGTLRCGCPWLDPKFSSQLLLLVFQDPVKCISQILSLMCYAMRGRVSMISSIKSITGSIRAHWRVTSSQPLTVLRRTEGQLWPVFYIFSKWFIYFSVKIFRVICIDMCPCVRDPANYEESCNCSIVCYGVIWKLVELAWLWDSWGTNRIGTESGLMKMAFMGCSKLVVCFDLVGSNKVWW